MPAKITSFTIIPLSKVQTSHAVPPISGGVISVCKFSSVILCLGPVTGHAIGWARMQNV